jgi:hypothetical protein
MKAIESKAKEYGIKVYEIVENNTLRYYALHNIEIKRKT